MNHTKHYVTTMIFCILILLTLVFTGVVDDPTGLKRYKLMIALTILVHIGNIASAIFKKSTYVPMLLKISFATVGIPILLECMTVVTQNVDTDSLLVHLGITIICGITLMLGRILHTEHPKTKTV